MKKVVRASQSLSIILVIAAVLFYWIYLAFVTQPIMVHDAKGYQDLGQMIVAKGWKAYFISGPNREPVYPFIIAGSMKLSGPESYMGMLKLLQLFLLLITVTLTWFLLKKSGVVLAITVPVILYLAISPAVTNSFLSVYSEIATYIFILAIVALSARAWLELHKTNAPASFWPGLGLAGVFIMAALVKSIYEMMFYLCLIPFLIITFKAWKERKYQLFKNALIFLLTLVVSFQAGIIGYKYLNKKYNGLFVLTDRAAWAFYGTAARREVVLTPESFGAAVTYKLFEEQGCKLFYNPEACRAWDITTADKFSAEKNYEVMARFPPQEQNKELLKSAFVKIMENPWQYAALMSLDWLRLFFWESTHIGFVAYPDWLDAIFDHAVFANGLRLVVGLISLASFIFCLIFLARNYKQYDQPLNTLIFFSVYVIFWHFILYSFFFTLPRFALPVAPLFLLIVAMSAQIIRGKS